MILIFHELNSSNEGGFHKSFKKLKFQMTKYQILESKHFIYNFMDSYIKDYQCSKYLLYQID